MTVITLLESLVLAAIVIAAVRGARPAAPPYGRRLLWLGFLLALQLGALYGFVAIQLRTGWGISHASPAGLAILTQIVRLALLLVAARAWLGLVRDELAKAWQRIALAAAFVGLGWGPSGAPTIAAILLFILFQRMKWYEALSGWRRVVGLVLSASVLIALTWAPYTTIADGKSHTLFAIGTRPWPPALLMGDVAARAELVLARPFDRMIQAIIDVFRLQLLVLVGKFLFLPIRLAGMSLKRRFWFNYVLVRSIPSLLSTLVFVGLFYLGIGYTRGVRVRGAFEQTLARAVTAAKALGDEWPPARGADHSRLDRVRAWLSPDGDGAHAILRAPGLPVVATFGAPDSILSPALSLADTSITRGLYVRGGRIYLTAISRSARGAIEVWVPLDSAYLARIMLDVGGSARLSAWPHSFVSSQGLRVARSRSWIARPANVRYIEPDSIAGRGQRWYLNRLLLPAGDWLEPPGLVWRGAIEQVIETTPRSLFTSTVRALGGLYSSLFLLLILAGVGMVVGMVEGFAVRSGKSILRAVLDEVGALRKAAEEFGAGRLDYRLSVKGRDEIGIVAASFNEMAASLQRQREELIAAERLEEDVAVAREIQRRFLPREAPRVSGLDLAGVSIPSRQVGGDLFYWFTHDDGSLGIALGDVSGKSISAALLMSNVLATLRAQVTERVDLAASLERTNRLIIGQIEPGRFVTLFYGEADPLHGTLRYVSAGHNPPLLLRANGETAWLREGGLPLGVQEDASYRAATIEFAHGDSLIVYSDGVTESSGPERAGAAPAGEAALEFFGEERLASIANDLRGRPARAVLDGLLEAVRRHADGVEQADDITIVVVRRA
jgi:serine phosphatase RsbU (regulator of sigma subunit)